MDFEKLGAFYLGKEFDTGSGKLLDRLVMYDSRDLTTHAVCVGMTGSGKTGLCIDLLEEAAIDKVPAIIIDPKGDISNLLLTFPNLRPEDFAPWVNVDDARRKGLTKEEFAAAQADLWKKGLKEWGQDGNRIRLLKESADFAVYTPGSEAGIPVSILQSFAAPDLDWSVEAEAGRDRIQGTVSALLGLVGIQADPVRSREHILLSSILEHFWRQGQDLTLPSLIMAVQKPPLRRLGVFDIDTFFPQGDRFKLAMSINSILAAPGFQAWLQGQPLDIQGFLATPDGKCRHSIFSIAHLNDAERMFFVTMLLNQVITWMRNQPGTTSLRALLYMDEIFGFFPPVANPPSKAPLLNLLKQARAFGLGVVLTTQNPVDLDYKGLSNAGTWFVGKLQTERDKERLLDGLESATSGSETGMDRSRLSNLVSGLGSRTFLLHNVHEDAPVTFRTRWAMSYLRGPLTRRQIRELMGSRTPDAVPEAAEAAGTVTAPAAEAPGLPPAGGAPPTLPAGVRQGFLPVRMNASVAALDIEGLAGGAREVVSHRLVYRPSLMGTGRIHFIDRRRKVDEEKAFGLLVPPPEASVRPDWERAGSVDPASSPMAGSPDPGASFDMLPESINEAKEMKALEKDLRDHFYRSSAIELLYSPAVKLYSLPGESERDFGLRLQQAIREKRDREVDKLERRFAGRLRRLSDKLRKQEEAIVKKETVAKSRKGEVLVSLGESLVGAFLGRRSIRGASTTLSKYRQSKTAAMSIEEARRAAVAVKGEISGLEEEILAKTEDISLKWEEAAEKIERVPVTPRRTDIEVDFFGLAWVPHWQITLRDKLGGTTTEDAPAF
jgi:DNA helicase HerA-like ATPase